MLHSREGGAVPIQLIPVLHRQGGGILIHLHDLAQCMPFLDQVTQGVVADNDFVQKDRPSQRARNVVFEPVLDMRLLIAVTIGTGDRVKHDLTANGAHERW